MKKLKRGQKECPKCHRVTGPRAKLCPNAKCKHEFEFKHKIFKKEKGQQVDWKSLRRGDRVKVLQVGGPHWECEQDHGAEGDTSFKPKGFKIPMGYSGFFMVSSVLADGFYAYGYKLKGEKVDAGLSFIYMGKPGLSPKTGIIRRPHKIRLIGRAADE
jgi:hypothetical protein